MALCFVNKHLIQESCDQLCAMTHSGSRIWGVGQSKAVALFFPVLHFWHTNTATENFHLGGSYALDRYKSSSIGLYNGGGGAYVSQEKPQKP